MHRYQLVVDGHTNSWARPVKKSRGCASRNLSMYKRSAGERTGAGSLSKESFERSSSRALWKHLAVGHANHTRDETFDMDINGGSSRRRSRRLTAVVLGFVYVVCNGAAGVLLNRAEIALPPTDNAHIPAMGSQYLSLLFVSRS